MVRGCFIESTIENLNPLESHVEIGRETMVGREVEKKVFLKLDLKDLTD